MAQYSKSFEREENRLMNKGIFKSFLAVLLCWFPVVGLIFAVSGFIRVCARITKAHRVKKFFMVVFTLIILIASLGSHIAAVYFYVRDPGIVDKLIHQGWKSLTGDDTLPWETPEIDYGYDYNDPYADDSEDFIEDESDGSYNDDFNDAELAGFEEDLTEDKEASVTDDDGLNKTGTLDLYYQMKSEKGISGSSPVG